MRVEMKTRVVIPVALFFTIVALIGMLGILSVKEEIIGSREVALGELKRVLRERDETIQAQERSLAQHAQDLKKARGKIGELRRVLRERDETIQAQERSLAQHAQDLKKAREKIGEPRRVLRERDETILDDEEF